jgi:hypothetical protein
MMQLDRRFEYIENHVAYKYKNHCNILLDQLARLPCLFMTEDRSGHFDHAKQRGHII